MRENHDLYPGQKFWLTIICFVITGIVIVAVVAIGHPWSHCA